MSDGHPLAAWAVERVLLALLVIAGVTTLTFALIHLAPGDPIYLLAGDGGSPSYYADMRSRYGLDRSLIDEVIHTRPEYGGRSLFHNFLPPSSEQYPPPQKDGDKGGPDEETRAQAELRAVMARLSG